MGERTYLELQQMSREKTLQEAYEQSLFPPNAAWQTAMDLAEDED